MVSLLSIVTVAAAVHLAYSLECTSDEGCVSSVNIDASRGSAMLQVRQQVAASAKSAPSEKMECGSNRGMEAPLTEEGFAEVSSSCCFDDVKEFTRRLIDSLGYKVCDEGGLSGISPFYACPTYPVTLANLTEELQDAIQTKSSKCHWLVDRYVECIPVSVECQVALYFPEPAPPPVAKGFIAFKATNPAEMVRANTILDLVIEELSLATGVETKYINVVMATGTVDGTESRSMLLAPLAPLRQIFSIDAGSKGGLGASCKVFALYSFQDKAPPAPEVLSESAVVNSMKSLDTTLIASRIAQDLEKVDAGVGVIEIAETAVCDNTSGKCTHNVVATPSFR
jgi:hypothetical protein